MDSLCVFHVPHGQGGLSLQGSQGTKAPKDKTSNSLFVFLIFGSGRHLWRVEGPWTRDTALTATMEIIRSASHGALNAPEAPTAKPAATLLQKALPGPGT